MNVKMKNNGVVSEDYEMIFYEVSKYTGVGPIKSRIEMFSEVAKELEIIWIQSFGSELRPPRGQ